jgi:hypothetical protein
MAPEALRLGANSTAVWAGNGRPVGVTVPGCVDVHARAADTNLDDRHPITGPPAPSSPCRRRLPRSPRRAREYCLPH